MQASLPTPWSISFGHWRVLLDGKYKNNLFVKFTEKCRPTSPSCNDIPVLQQGKQRLYRQVVKKLPALDQAIGNWCLPWLPTGIDQI